MLYTSFPMILLNKLPYWLLRLRYVWNCLSFMSLIGLVSCSGNRNTDDQVFSNDFENLIGWGCEHPSLTKDQAFSGRYAVKIDNNIENSLGFYQTLGEVTAKKPRVIKVECQAYLHKDSKGSLVVSIGAPGAPQAALWEAIPLHQEVSKYEQWVQISKAFKVPDSVQFSDKILCHLWRSEGTSSPTYIDDLKITVLE